MTDKYYTPELSEFHVGFECEIRGNKNDEFAKAVVSLYSIYTMDASRPLTTLMAYPIDKTNNMIGIHVFESELDGFVRVKYLDNEDIESCGWIKDKNGRYTKGYSEIIFVGDLNHPNKYRINFCGNCYFCGYIKNKSELIRVMKMLGI